MTTFEGKFIGKDVKIAIVVARFNEFITSKLLGGAMDGLIRNEVAKEAIDVYWVPGAFEIPFKSSQVENTTVLSHLVALFVGQLVITILFVMKWQKVSGKSISQATFQSCLA